MNVIVQKYGGSSVAQPEKIKLVAKYIRKCLDKHARIIVVVSAMGNTTNDLIALAHEVSHEPTKRELDMLLSCGERSSMALLAMALNDIGVKALSLTGSQSGIITDSHHRDAEIIEVKPGRVLQALIDHNVVIIAGFQGVSQEKEITTLRRGGSDTTAVAMAAAVSAEVCEIYTDVPGVMDIDPKIAKHASIIPMIHVDHMEAMALYGAKVLAHDAVRIAKERGVTLRIAKTGEAAIGTIISQSSCSSSRSIVAITHLRALVRIAFDMRQSQSSINLQGYFLCGSLFNNQFNAYVSNDIAQELLIAHHNDNVVAQLALITLHNANNHDAWPNLMKIQNILHTHNLNYEDLIVGHNEIFLIVADQILHDVLSIMHQSFFVQEHADDIN